MCYLSVCAVSTHVLATQVCWISTLYIPIGQVGLAHYTCAVLVNVLFLHMCWLPQVCWINTLKFVWYFFLQKISVYKKNCQDTEKIGIENKTESTHALRCSHIMKNSIMSHGPVNEVLVPCNVGILILHACWSTCAGDEPIMCVGHDICKKKYDRV